MAKYIPGPLGPLRGKMGNLVASNWRDIYYIKVKSKRSTKEASEKQKIGQQGFGFVSSWLSCMHQFLLVHFKDYNPSWDGRLSAQSYNYKNALIRTATGFDIDYRAARFCYGDLPGVQEVTVAKKNEETIVIKWSTEMKEKANDSDALIYIIVAPALDHTFITDIKGSRRDGVVEVELPEPLRRGVVHVQIAFKSVVNEKTSISQYAGSVNFRETSNTEMLEGENTVSIYCQSSGLTGSLIKRIGRA